MKDAEIGSLALDYETTGLASMGPRRERRGNLDVIGDAEASYKLQWGRVVKDAEINAQFIMHYEAMIASMGPRRERRGNP